MFKDRNGKIIKVGDIVIISAKSIKGNFVESVHIVKKLNGKLINCPKWLLNKQNKNYYIEVIGKINKELLNEN